MGVTVEGVIPVQCWWRPLLSALLLRRFVDFLSVFFLFFRLDLAWAASDWGGWGGQIVRNRSADVGSSFFSPDGGCSGRSRAARAY